MFFADPIKREKVTATRRSVRSHESLERNAREELIKNTKKKNDVEKTSGAMELLKSIASKTVQYLRELLLSNSSC